MSAVRISGKDLGALALPSFCPRCFWIKRRVNGKLPFQTFPGIFSSIDSYTKKVIHGRFDRERAFPMYLSGLGELESYVNPPHFSKFSRDDAESGVQLWGAPDAIFKLTDGSYIIADYKTSRFTKAQDSLLPMYEVQLNAYAYIGEVNDIAPVTKLALLYFEPETEEDLAVHEANRTDTGFRMGFSCGIKLVELDTQKVKQLLSQVSFFSQLDEPPRAREGCEDCAKLDAILSLLR